MQALIPGDELVGKRKAGAHAALFKPEDGAERAREQNTLHSAEPTRTR